MTALLNVLHPLMHMLNTYAQTKVTDLIAAADIHQESSDLVPAQTVKSQPRSRTASQGRAIPATHACPVTVYHSHWYNHDRTNTHQIA